MKRMEEEKMARGRDVRPSAGDKPGWRDLPTGGLIIEAGNGSRYLTGDWRGGTRPRVRTERCTGCMLCWVFCPDAAIIVENGKVVDSDYDHCKGCGICAVECPVRPVAAIEMVAEDEEE